MTDLNKLPYAKWLERSLQNIIGKPVETICILTKMENGEVGTGYYNCAMGDKLLFAGIVNQDAMLDTLEANGLLGLDDDETEDMEDEDYDE